AGTKPGPGAPAGTVLGSGAPGPGLVPADGVSVLAQPFAWTAVVSLIGIVPFIVRVQNGQFGEAAMVAASAAAAWAMLAFSQRWQWAVSGMQTMLAIAPALVVAGIWRSRIGGNHWAWDQQHLYAQLIAAALATLVWSTVRRLTHERDEL